ncbi:hypothetical protein LSAT2_010615 [Lamellibrachia satsuma]|nr:hypothetical protein LSAT2_010615 [Lamellibrachia satsuma]
MDNMKPLIEAVSDDRKEDTATEDEAGQPNCRGAREDGQRWSSCGRRGPSGPPHGAAMTSQPGGPPSFIHGSSRFGPMECPWGRGPPFTNGPPQWACPWDRGMPPMNDFGPIDSPWNRGPPFMHGPHAFGPMACPCGTRPPWADETVDTDSDEEHAGKASAGNAGKEAQERTQQAHDPHKQQGGAREEKSGQQRPRCPCGDRLRRHKIRCSLRLAECRRHDPHPMYRRCRRGFGPQSHCAPWSTFRGDCCQPGAPMGWGECPYPPPFFGPFACDSSGESNSHPENDNQKQDANEQTPQEFCHFFQGPLGFCDRGRPSCCHGNGRVWKCGPSREKLVSMLSWKHKVLKEKLRRIESHLERLRPNENETKETTTGDDAGPEQASSMHRARAAASPMDTNPEEASAKETSAERGWEVIADSQ